MGGYHIHSNWSKIHYQYKVTERDFERMSAPPLGASQLSLLRYFSSVEAATGQDAATAFGKRRPPSDNLMVLRERGFINMAIGQNNRKVYSITPEGLNYLKNEEPK